MENNIQSITTQSISLDWLKAPSEKDRASLIEFTRGTLCSLSMREDGNFAPVHVSRIQRCFKKIGAAGLYKGGLRLIQLLREAEPLDGGYWLLTPYRVVEIEDDFVFIGATPNAHGLLGVTKAEGLGRILASDVADRFPRQSLEGWMDATSQDSSAIVAAFVATHMHAEARTSNLMDVMYLKLNSWRFGYSQFQWCDKPVGLLSAGQIGICRQSYHGGVRYFSASLRKGGIISEAPIDIPISRLLFALARHAGSPVRAITQPGPRGVEVTVGERLPIGEFRLALLVSREIVRTGFSTTFHFSPKLASAFCVRLTSLGCALEAQQ